MVMPRIIEFLPLVAMLTVVAVIDWRERRIRNWLTLCIALTGVVHALSVPGSSLTGAALGMVLGFCIMFPQFAISALGGGDLKLMVGIGAWLGWFGTLEVWIGASIVGLVIVLVQCAVKGRLIVLFGNTMALLTNVMLIDEMGLDHLAKTGKECRSVDRPLPYAVSVLVALILLISVH